MRRYCASDYRSRVSFTRDLLSIRSRSWGAELGVRAATALAAPLMEIAACGSPLNLLRIPETLKTDVMIFVCAVPPMIAVPNQLVGAPTDTNVTIDCHIEAYPRAISYWVFRDQMLLATPKYAPLITENSYRAHMQLTVRSLQQPDFGKYRCISKNSLGETEGFIRVYGKCSASVGMCFKSNGRRNWWRWKQSDP